MGLVIEDGSGVEGANSYATVAQARAYASARGLSFPPDTTAGNVAAELLLINAADALEMRAAEFKGTKTSRDQALQFPRVGVEAEGYEYDSDEIPPQLIKAQIILAIESQTTPLVVNSTEQRLLSLKVAEAVEMQFADEEADGAPTFPQVEALLAPLFGDGSDGFSGSFEVVRV